MPSVGSIGDAVAEHARPQTPRRPLPRAARPSPASGDSSDEVAHRLTVSERDPLERPDRVDRGRAKRRHRSPRPACGGIRTGPITVTPGLPAAAASGTRATGSPRQSPVRISSSPLRGPRVAAADRVRVLADLEVEWQLAHGGAERCAPREIRVAPDPAGIDDVHVEDRALALERRVVLEAQHEVAACNARAPRPCGGGALLRSTVQPTRSRRAAQLAVERGCLATVCRRAASNGPVIGGRSAGAGSLPSRVKRIVPNGACFDSSTRSCADASGARASSAKRGSKAESA